LKDTKTDTDMDTFVAARSVLLMGVNELPKQNTKIDYIEKLGKKLENTKKKPVTKPRYRYRKKVEILIIIINMNIPTTITTEWY